MAVNVFAMDAIVVGAQVTLTYKEPATNADGSALSDLKLTTVYYSVNGGATVKGLETLASSVTGGASRTVTLNIPIVDSKETVLKFWATATDESLNESLQSVTVVKRIDKLAPSAPE
jgi:hypothetical protein